jgi:hypothetical protein
MSAELSPTLSEHSDDLRLSGPVDTQRPSAEAVPTPVAGLKTRPDRRRTYLVAACAVLLLIGGPVLWLALRGGDPAATPTAHQLPPPLPERAGASAAGAHTPEPAAPAAPALAPEPVPEPVVADAPEDTRPAQAVPPESTREARESRRHHAQHRDEAHEEPAPEAPVAAPAAKERTDPTLRSDGNPYLRR